MLGNPRPHITHPEAHRACTPPFFRALIDQRNDVSLASTSPSSEDIKVSGYAGRS